MKKIIVVLFPLLFLPLSFYGQTTVTLTSVGTSSFTVPAGVTSLDVECWGAGGAGGGTNGNASAAGGGGGGGAYSKSTIAVTSGSTISYTIGAGGNGTTGNGANGGPTSFSTVSANGGHGGFQGNSNIGAGGAGGIGGLYNGGNGANGILSTSGGGGGGSAGSASNGNSATNGTGATAVTNGAAGGNGGVGFVFIINFGNNGASAANPGGGGGGGDNGDFGFLGFFYSGGDGGDGQIKITYNCGAYSLTSTAAASVNVCAGNSSIITLNSTASGLPIGLYSVAYEIQGVAQTPAVMNVTTAGTGTFIASGFTTIGTRTVKITRITSQSCYTDIIANNLTTVTVNSTLSAPTALAGSGATCTQITANWNAVPGATYYELDVATDSGFTTFVSGYNALNVGNVVTRNITGLTSGVTYYYRVRAFNGTCISSNSLTITYATAATPGAPGGLTVVVNSCDELTVSWTAGAGATSYEIQWSTNASNFATILGTTTGITSLTYTITGLTNGVAYKYRIRSVNGCSSSGYTTSASVTLGGALPTRPASITASGALCNQFNVTWPAGTGATSYKIEWSLNAGFAPILGTMSGITALTYTITGLSASTTYYYRVWSENGCGLSATVRTGAAGYATLAATPGSPTGVSSSSVLCTQFTMSWTAGSGATSYTVERALNAGFSTGLVTVTGITATTYTFTGLTPNTTYFYRVRAVSSCGSSVFVNGTPTSRTTLNSVPTTPTISTVDNIPFCQTDGATLTSSSGTTYLWSTGETTSSIFVTTAGSYTVQVTNASGCQSNSSSPTVVTVHGLPTATAGGNQAICSNGTATVSGAAATNGTILWTHNGTGTLSSATTLTPTYTPAIGDIGTTVTLTMTVTSNNTCAPQIATATYTVPVTSMPLQPTLGSVTQTTCSVATGSFSITNYDASYTYAVTPSTGVTISGSVITAPAGTYTVTATLGSCTSVASSSVIVNAQPTNTWNGTWSSGSAPTSNEKIVFAANYNSSSDVIGCSCQVNSGVTVTFDSGNTLTVLNSLTVISGGTLQFEDNAGLVQTNDAAVNSGNIIYERETTPLKQFDYTYWSSPVVSAPLSQLATNSLFYSFSPTINNWVYQTGATTMLPGVGYIGRAPTGLTYSPTQIVETSFVGVPNNGVITTPIVKSSGTYNLIGNPYPCAIDADLFITANTAVTNGTLYFWTHNTAITNNVYTINDYAKYNYTGGVGTLPAASGGPTPTGKIAAGQGFFVEAKTSLANGTYSATFDNAMRIAGNNNQFFKNGTAATTTNSISEGLERHRVWLSLRSAIGAYNQMLVGYVEGATNDFDSLFDGKTFAVGNSVSIYTMNGADNLAIQGKALPFSETDVIPIGYSTTLNGELTINLDNFDGLFTSQNVYLLDKITNTLHDIKAAPYTFVTTNGTFADRFELRYTDVALGTSSPTITANDIKIITNNNGLEILSPASAITKIQVYDILGKLLFTQNGLNTNLFQTDSLHLAPQVLLVKVSLDNHKTYTKKVLME